METKYKNMFAVAGIIFLISATIFVIFLTRNELLKTSFIGLDTENLPTLRLQGEGVVYVSPDKAEVVFSVITESEDSEEALRENNRKMNDVIEYLKNEEVGDENIRTGDVSIVPMEDWREDLQTGRRIREIYAYRARNIIEVQLKDLERAGEIISGAVAAGVNEVSRFNLVVSDEEAYKKEAREKAIKEAREKGEEIASALGVRLKRIISFSEDRYYYPMMRAEMDMVEIMEEVPSEAPIEPGENEIKVNVTVEYEIR